MMFELISRGADVNYCHVDTAEYNERGITILSNAIFLLRPCAVVLLLVDDVRLHADREVAAGRATFDAAPLVDLPGLAGRDLNVGARLAHRIGSDELAISLVERIDGNTHREKFRHVRIADDQHATRRRI